jgi:hypothetical protein
MYTLPYVYIYIYSLFILRENYTKVYIATTMHDDAVLCCGESFLLILPKICEALCSEMDQTEICLVVVMQLAILLAGTEPSTAKDCCSELIICTAVCNASMVPMIVVGCFQHQVRSRTKVTLAHNTWRSHARSEKRSIIPVPRFTKPRCVGITTFSALARLKEEILHVCAAFAARQTRCAEQWSGLLNTIRASLSKVSAQRITTS